ncbi:hypothetical protein MBLNU459_g4802t1 [Dothideomycetes sp. NU459]
MGFLQKFLPPEDRTAALLLYHDRILADKQFIAYYNLDANKSGLVATVPWVTTGISQLFLGGTLAAWLGRLWALRTSIIIMCLGVVIQAVPNTYGVLLAGRRIAGLGFGCVYISTVLYTTECGPTKLRASFVGTVTQFGYQLGTLIAFWAGYGMSFHKHPENVAWRVSNVIQIPIGIAFVILPFRYPESRRWLLEKYPDDPQRCLETLALLRSGETTDEKVQAEFHELVASQEFRKRYTAGYLGIFKSPALRKRLCYGFYAMALQQVGGIAALTMYATLIYQSLGWGHGSQALAINGIQSVLQLAIVLVNTFTIDRFGRKPLLILGFAIQALALLILSSLTTAFPANTNRAAAIVEIAMFFIVGLTYCWSNGPITPAIAAECFPQHVRDKAFGLSALGQTVCLLALTQLWPTFHNEVGAKNYWLLFSLNVAARISVIIILPETKGTSLERMDRLFGGIDYVAASEQETNSMDNEVVAYGKAGCRNLVQTLDFKCALVTGGGGGIGKEMSRYFISQGKKVIICGRTESKLENTSKEIGCSGYYKLDTGDIESIPDFIKKITTEHPDLDCIVNNAGVQRPLSVDNMDAQEFLEKADNEININIRGPMHLAVGLLPHFRSKKSGVIINVSSVLGFIPTSVQNPVYNGTKAFVHFNTMNLRTQLEQAGDNIKVVEIAPPSVGTDLHRERSDPDDNKKDKNPAALSLDEFMKDVIQGWEQDKDTIGAGPSQKVIERWYGEFGQDYAKAAGAK